MQLLCVLASSPTSPLSYQLFPWLFLWLFLWHAAAGWQSYCSVINYSYAYFYSYSYTYSYVVSYGTQLLAGSPTYESASRVHSHTCCFKGHVMPSKGLFVFLLALGKHSEQTLELLIKFDWRRYEDTRSVRPLAHSGRLHEEDLFSHQHSCETAGVSSCLSCVLRTLE